MKKMSLLTLGVTILTVSLASAAKEKEKAKEFELFNKTGNPVWFTVKNRATDSSKVYETADKKQQQVDIDTNDQTILSIYFKNPAQPAGATGVEGSKGSWGETLTKFVKGVAQTAKRAVGAINPDKQYTFTKGKTIYVTLRPNGLTPQTGKWDGLRSVTESGLSRKNNVKQVGITEIA